MLIESMLKSQLCLLALGLLGGQAGMYKKYEMKSQNKINKIEGNQSNK